MARRVVLTPEARKQSRDLRSYIARVSYPSIADEYIARLVRAMEVLGEAPFQGTKREDLGPGLRTTGFERRVTLLFAVRDADVVVAGVFYAGRRPRRS